MPFADVTGCLTCHFSSSLILLGAIWSLKHSKFPVQVELAQLFISSILGLFLFVFTAR